MRAEVGLIGGTGVGELLAQEGGVPIRVPTPYGLVAGRIAKIESKQVLLLSRHSAGHSVPPHKVNYRAMALALHQMGVRYCLATAAVGSLDAAKPVGSMLVCSDFLDLTFRNVTLYDDAVVHTPFAAPFGEAARAAILDGAEQAGIAVNDGGTYVGLNGPRFESPKEIMLLGKIGDVVGMTASSEAVAIKETGIEYAVLAIVTNLGEGLGGAVEHGLVGKTMKELGPKAVSVLKKAITSLPT